MKERPNSEGKKKRRGREDGLDVPKGAEHHQERRTKNRRYWPEGNQRGRVKLKKRSWVSTI